MKKLIWAFALSMFPSVCFSAGTGWVSIGSFGTFSQNSSTAAWTVLTTAALEQGNAGICIWASDNDGDGTDNNDFTTMTSEPVTVWRSSGINSTAQMENEIDPGANNAGAAVGIFWTVASVDLPVGSRLTINNASAEVARAGTCWEFDVSDNAILQLTSIIRADDGGVDASTMTNVPAGALEQKLFIRGIASETTNGDIATLTPGFTKITSATADTGTEATSMGVVGEFVILTSISQGSDPTMSDTTADRASVYLLMDEEPTVSGSGQQAVIVID